MESSQFLFLLPYLLSLSMSLAVGWITVKRPYTYAARPFVFLCATEAIWTAGYIFQLLSEKLGEMLFWNNVQFLGAASLPLAFLAFTQKYNNSKNLFSKFRVFYLFPLAAAVLALVWTDGITHWFRTNPGIQYDHPFFKLVFTDGPLFPLYTLYAYTLISLGAIFLIINIITAPQIYRAQIGLVTVGILIPWVFSLVTAAGWVDLGLHQIMPLTFGFSNLMIAFALFRYKLFDTLPVARDTLLEKMHDGMLVIDPSHRVIDLNENVKRILWLTGEQLFSRSIEEILPAEAQSALDLLKVDHASGIFTFSTEKKSQLIEIDSTSLKQGSSQTGYLWILRDVTEQQTTEWALRRSNALAQAVVDSTLNGILVVNEAFEVLLSNDSLRAVFPLPEDWDRQPNIWAMDMLAQFVSDPNIFYSQIMALEAHAKSQTPVSLELINGRSVDWVTTPYEVDGTSLGWMFIFQDITEQKKATNDLLTMAHSDSLTGIANRRYFFEVAQQEMERCLRYQRQMAMIIADIDHFKKVNDSFGHLQGDQVLEAVSILLNQNKRSFDFLGRYGGEEFILLLPETDLITAGQIADRLRKTIEEMSVTIHKVPVHVTVSLGVAAFPLPSERSDLDDLINAADEALYRAKANGRNCVALHTGEMIPRS